MGGADCAAPGLVAGPSRRAVLARPVRLAGRVSRALQGRARARFRAPGRELRIAVRTNHSIAPRRGTCAASCAGASSDCVKIIATKDCESRLEWPCGAVWQSRTALSQRALAVPYQPGPFYFARSRAGSHWASRAPCEPPCTLRHLTGQPTSPHRETLTAGLEAPGCRQLAPATWPTLGSSSLTRKSSHLNTDWPADTSRASALRH